MQRSAEDYVDFWLYFMITVITIPAILLNSILIFIYLANRKYKSTFDMAYLNLALSDAAFAVSGLLKGIGGSLDLKTCTMHLYLFNFAIYTNMLAVLPITYDRYIAVIAPYKYRKKTHKRILQLLMVLCWVASGIILAVTVAVADKSYVPHNNNNNNNTTIHDNSTESETTPWTFYDKADNCSFVVNQDRENARTILQAVIYATFFFTPLIINIVVYTLIVLSLNKSKQKSINPKLILIKAILINSTFTLSWLPYVFVADFFKIHDRAALAVVRVFMYVNSLTDPILYAFSSRAIKMCLLRLDKSAKKSLVRKMSASFGKTLTSRSGSLPKVEKILVIQNSAASILDQPQQDLISMNVFLDVQ